MIDDHEIAGDCLVVDFLFLEAVSTANREAPDVGDIPVELTEDCITGRLIDLVVPVRQSAIGIRRAVARDRVVVEAFGPISLFIQEPEPRDVTYAIANGR